MNTTPNVCEDCGESHPAEPAPDFHTPPTGLLRAVIFDVDGTLAIRGDRCPFDNGPAVLADTPHLPVIRLARELHAAGNLIVITSGRQEKCRAETEEWLRRHLRVRHAALFMRPTGDRRPDYEIKAEMWAHIRTRWGVWLAVDDRDQVVDYWRRGARLLCAQVAPGAF